jgi:hypothetical protein
MYWIARHVHVCLTRDGAIWLDTKKDRYSGISHEAFHLLLPLLQVPDPGDSTGPVDSPVMAEAERAIGEQLLCKGLITRDSRIGKPFSPPALSVLRLAAPVGIDAESPCVGARHVCTFLYACTATLISLRVRSLHYSLDRARRVKATGQISGQKSGELAYELMHIFTRLRTYVYTARRACLYDSLAAFNFLSYYGVFPDIVIGVRANPFSAHCWLQQHDSVLTGRPEFCADFVPILVV